MKFIPLLLVLVMLLGVSRDGRAQVLEETSSLIGRWQAISADGEGKNFSDRDLRQTVEFTKNKLRISPHRVTSARTGRQHELKLVQLGLVASPTNQPLP